MVAGLDAESAAVSIGDKRTANTSHGFLDDEEKCLEYITSLFPTTSPKEPPYHLANLYTSVEPWEEIRRLVPSLHKSVVNQLCPRSRKTPNPQMRKNHPG